MAELGCEAGPVFAVGGVQVDGDDPGPARGVQRAIVTSGVLTSGTDLRLVVPSPTVRRTLSINGVDWLVSVYPSRDAALAANFGPHPADGPGGRQRGASADDSRPAARRPAPVPRSRCWTAMIVSVNDAGCPSQPPTRATARTGRDVSYLEACAAAGVDPVALEVAAVIRCQPPGAGDLGRQKQRLRPEPPGGRPSVTGVA